MLYVMNCIIRNTIAAFLLFAGCSLGKAHDFTATVGGQKLFFNIKSKTNKTVEVTYSGSISDKNISEVTGIIDIPAKVKHNMWYILWYRLGPSRLVVQASWKV